MCLPMILGSGMEILSSPTLVGSPCPESFMTAQDFSSALDLESAFSADLDGAGTTGAGTGTAIGCSTTTTTTSRTAERSSIATISTATITITAVTHSAGAIPWAEIQHSVGR